MLLQGVVMGMSSQKILKTSREWGSVPNITAENTCTQFKLPLDNHDKSMWDYFITL